MGMIVIAFVAAVFLSASFAGALLAEDAGKEAGSVVSKAAHSAKSEGLKGQGMAEKVHAAIDARKEGKESVKAAEKAAREKGGEAAWKVKKEKEAKEKESKEKSADQKRGKTHKQNFEAKSKKNKAGK